MHWTRRFTLSAGLSACLWLAGCATVALDPEPTASTAGSATPSQPAPTVPSGNSATGPATSPTTPARPARPASGPALPSGPLQDIAVVSTATPPVAVAEVAPPTDLWERIRRGFAMQELDGTLVRDQERWYASRPDYIQRMTERSSKYLFHIVEELERRNMPSELALLPFIESAFNPQAVSPVKAAGMWQFMPATGKSFDLKQNAFRDDRRDVLESTRAALDYLQQLHKRFGDWHLALAAYNWGQGNVNRAITRNTRAGLPTAYTDLTMPAETRQYVPKLQAVKNIVSRPDAFGARLPEIGNHPFFDTVTIERDMDVALIARLAEVDEKDLRQLNPSANRPVILAAGRPTVLLPWDNAAVFQRNLKDHSGPLATWTAWTVPSHMSAPQVAQRVGMGEAQLREVNDIPARMLVRAGSTLLVPRDGHRDADVPAHVADNGQILLTPEVVLRRVKVKARKGETLAALARRHRVDAASAAEWNRLSANAVLKAGQSLTLYLPAKASTAKKATGPKKATARKKATGQAKKAVKTAQPKKKAKGTPRQ